MECNGLLNSDGSCTLELGEIPQLDAMIQITLPVDVLSHVDERTAYQMVCDALPEVERKLMDVIFSLPMED